MKEKAQSLFGPAEPARVETLAGQAQGLPYAADDHARCMRCDDVQLKARMHARPDGLHLCRKCDRKGSKGQGTDTQTGSLF